MSNQLIDLELARDVDLVVTLGREAQLDALPTGGVNPGRGIDGLERMRLVETTSPPACNACTPRSPTPLPDTYLPR
ncbi:hypothetical protein MARA_62170 [Mycolicibacterium arabiense]|uniref:Uncharacterized protein n=1 Tax=Mycolicibacterium arabiense TaxID=1286181 RepID=A0A7I7S8V8_9MYCO|nr:hypothetical protein MARA_62170 [Mycolicibacterium arabiense]